MSRRGRGTLEVKESASPYFQTTSSAIGSDPLSESSWKQSINQNQKEKSTSTTNFAFLYTRESDKIGRSNLNTIDMETDKKCQTVALECSSFPQENDKVARNKATEEFITAYRHEPKPEHPRYSTSSNEVGRKRPTMATAVLERHGTAQEFSRSFGNVKPINSRMNTSITRSTVHSQLDSQFL